MEEDLAMAAAAEEDSAGSEVTGIKGIVSRETLYKLRPLVFSLGLNNPPRRYFIL
jgi:hypothetical protein